MTEIWQRNEIDSPCIKICVIHPDAKICVGCHRTGEEIGIHRRNPVDEPVRLTRERRCRHAAHRRPPFLLQIYNARLASNPCRPIQPAKKVRPNLVRP